MRFNYDNPYNILAMVPHGACGQFLNNCISMSKHLMPIACDSFLDAVLDDGLDQQSKFDHMLGVFPDRDNDKSWHGMFYHSSRWYSPAHWARTSIDIDDLTNGYFQYGLDPSYAQQYMDKYWRDHAIKISIAGHGIVIPAHELRDLEGWRAVFPNAKVYSVKNFEQISYKMTSVKKGNSTPQIIKQYYIDNPWVYEPRGFVFDLIGLLSSEESFYTQMKLAYEYFSLDDHRECNATLFEYRKRYLRANTKWSDVLDSIVS